MGCKEKYWVANSASLGKLSGACGGGGEDEERWPHRPEPLQRPRTRRGSWTGPRGATATAGTPPAPCTSLTAAAATFTQTSPNTTKARDANNDNCGETLLTPCRAPASSFYPPMSAAWERPIVPDAAGDCMCLVERVASSASTANVNTKGRTRPTPPSGSLRMTPTGTARLAQSRGCGRVRQQRGILCADRIHCKGVDGVSGKDWKCYKAWEC
eukprot:gene10250-biopygen722